MLPQLRQPWHATLGNTVPLVVVGLLLLAVLPYPVPSDLHASWDDRPRPVPPPPELAALQAELARLAGLGYSAAQFRDAYSMQAWLGGPSRSQQRAAAPYPVRLFAQRMGKQFASAATYGLLPCTWDDSLPVTMQQPGMQVPAQAATASAEGAAPAAMQAPKYFLASNQHNSARAMPNFVLQLLSLAVLLPQGSLHVSIYESGSKDSTPEWLQLLGLLLASIDVPANITVRGSLTREKGQDRLAFLASLRNAALEPLAAMAAARGAASQAIGAAAPAHAGTAATHSPTSQLPDYVVFVNDVYFCAANVVRLMQHRADMACGLDASRTLAGSPWPSRLLPLPLEFYDYWVARDIDGRRLQRYPPHAVDPVSVARMRAGLPFGVYCCWNGLVVLRAAPFLAGLRFRSRLAAAGECDASECSLMCDDFQRLGFWDAVVDPGVRVAYDWSVAKALAGGWLEQSLRVPWSSVAAAASYRHAPAQHQQHQQRQQGGASSKMVECCPKIPGGEHADFSKCTMVDVFAVNHTRTVLGG